MIIITAKDWRKERIRDCSGRYELKSTIDPDLYSEITSELKQFMRPDPYGSRDGWYSINSLYYDTPGFDAYRAKLGGDRKRNKLRIRTYSDPFNPRPVNTAHVEIKEKDGPITRKRRLMLPVKMAERLCKGKSINDLNNLADQTVAKEVEKLVLEKKLEPACHVGYLRQAFVGGGYYPDLRITFDTNLYGNASSVESKPLLPDDKIIMEVKFNQHIPDWAVGMIAENNCMAESISKYCMALETDMHRILRRLA